MNLSEDFELLESLFLELDPLENGFGGVLLEIHRNGRRWRSSARPARRRWVGASASTAATSWRRSTSSRRGGWSSEPLIRRIAAATS
jgi:hypothetical protein